MQTTGLEARRCGCLEVIECKPVEVGAEGSLKAEVLGDIPYALTRETDNVLVGVVEVLIKIPIGIDIVRIHAIPVGIVAVLILIGPEPCLVVGGGEGHEVLAHVRLAVAEGRAVLDILAGVVGAEVEVHLAHGGVGTQVEDVAAHVRLRHDVLVAHVGEGEADARLTIVHAHDGGVGGRETRAEETGGIVGDDEVGTLHTIEIFQHVGAVGLWAPALVGIRHGIDAVLAVAAHAINLLGVVPFSQLGIEGQRAVVLHAHLVLVGLLGGDEDDAVAGAAAVEGRGSGAFEHRHRLDVVGVDAGDAVAEVETAVGPGAAEVGIVQRHAVDDIERLVVARHLGVTTEYDARAAAGTACRLADDESGNLTGERVDDIGLFGFLQLVAFYFAHAIAQGLALALDAEGCDDDLIEGFLVFLQDDGHAVVGFHGQRFVADVAHFQNGAWLDAQGEMAIEVSNGS